MGRPKKDDSGTEPTRERIITAATELFATRGYDAVSVRDITRALGLNEASLYNHFEGKAGLLEAVFARLSERMVTPGFAASKAALDATLARTRKTPGLADLILGGAKFFFARADADMLKTWRILVSTEFFHEAARDGVRKHFLETPREYFRAMLKDLHDRGLIRADADCAAAADCLVSVFFEFSFESNLDLAWNDTEPAVRERMVKSVTLIAHALEENNG
jgi:AcrR family transcriptional regulator